MIRIKRSKKVRGQESKIKKKKSEKKQKSGGIKKT